MANKVRYNSTTGKWESVGGSGGNDRSEDSSSSKKSIAGGSSSGSGDGNKDSSSSKAQEKYNDIDYYNLQGTLNYIATTSTIKIKAGDTITIKGIGKYLSGKYYVVSVKRTIDSSGYSHSAEVVRMNFGSNKTTTSSKDTSKKKEQAKTKTTQKTYTVVKGDCLYSIATHFYGKGSKYTLIYNANKDKIKDPSHIYAGQVLVIP